MYMHDVYMSADVWILRGVEECGETSVVVHSSHGQLFTWEGFGLKLHIHENSLPEGMQQCTINIKASLAGQYEFPENSHLVSAIFWLRCEPQCTFTRPITVEIQHCGSEQNASKLKVVRALCSQKVLPYKFRHMGGNFTGCSSYGVIKVKNFSSFGITQTGAKSDRIYYCRLFYRGHPDHCRHDIHIIFTWNTEAHFNVRHIIWPIFTYIYECIH